MKNLKLIPLLMVATVFGTFKLPAQEKSYVASSLQLGLLAGYNFSQKDPLIGSLVNYQYRFSNKWAITGGLSWDYSRITVPIYYLETNKRLDLHEFDINIGAKYYFNKFNASAGISPLGMGDIFGDEIQKPVKALPINLGVGYQLKSKSGNGPEIFVQSMGIAEFKIGLGLRYNFRLGKK